MPAEAVEATLLALWERTAPGGVLALVEPATAEGFGQLTLAREILCGSGEAGGVAGGEAQIVAPCAHMQRCPLAPGGPLQEWHAGKRRRKQKDLCYSSQRYHESNARSFSERKSRRGRERLQHTADFS